MTDARTGARRAPITVQVLAVVVPIGAILAANNITFGFTPGPQTWPQWLTRQR